MTRFLLFAVVITVALSAFLSARVTATQDPTDVILPGCDIPKSYGRLVTIVDGPGARGGPGGAVSQAVFEADDQTIRWVSVMQVGMTATTGSSQQIRPAFVLNYECSLGGAWKRH